MNPHFLLVLLLALASCQWDPIGLKHDPHWEVESIAVWRHAMPDMIAVSTDGKHAYISCETEGGSFAPSLARIRLDNGHRHFLLYGLMRADGLKMAPDGSLWLGEETNDGRIWRIAEPDVLPEEIHLDRKGGQRHPAVAVVRAAGRFAHEGIAFSADGRFAYLGEDRNGGFLYRLDLRENRLEVLLTDGQWGAIRDPDDARSEAMRLNARGFDRIEDMEILPDGRILMAETGSSRVLALHDTDRARITTYLRHPRLRHPDNLAWDHQRGWLWITDDSIPSTLWAWDGSKLMEIAKHPHAEITGVAIHNENVLINLQGRTDGPDLTLRLWEAP